MKDQTEESRYPTIQAMAFDRLRRGAVNVCVSDIATACKEPDNITFRALAWDERLERSGTRGCSTLFRLKGVKP